MTGTMKMRKVLSVGTISVALVILFVFITPQLLWPHAVHPKHLRTFAHFTAVLPAVPASLSSIAVAEAVEPSAAYMGSLGDRLALLCARLC
jgi:hypothetical protein